VGANRADEVGQVEAILVAQGGCDQSQKLGVSYGHEFGSECVQPKSNTDLINYITKWLFNPLFDLSSSQASQTPPTLSTSSVRLSFIHIQSLTRYQSIMSALSGDCRLLLSYSGHNRLCD
jgi:hypothetical protein